MNLGINRENPGSPEFAVPYAVSMIALFVSFIKKRCFSRANTQILKSRQKECVLKLSVISQTLQCIVVIHTRKLMSA